MHRPDYIFAKPDIDGVLGNLRAKLRAEVAQIDAAGLSSDAFAATEARLLAKYSIAPLEIEWEQADVAKEEVMETRESDFGHGRTFQRQEVVLRIKVPFSGEKDLFKFSPVAFPNLLPRAHVRPGELEFVYQAAQHELARLRQEYDEDMRMTKACVTRTNELLTTYHEGLPAQVRQSLEARRNQLNVVDAKLAELGFSVRKRDQPLLPVNFPVTRKQIIKPLPPAARPPSAPPHRVLESGAYDEILTFLAGMSLAIERSPSTFAGIQEEPLRDWFLVALNGTFRGEATGETFNREGKTDLSIRVDGEAIFIAECKFWSGAKGLLEAMDQLRGYLTWRDSKAGILLFVRNADFSAVLGQIRDVVGGHPNFVRHLPYASDTGFRFVLRNKSDAGREHIVTLLAFHVPPV